MTDLASTEPTTFADFGKEMWDYLTGRGAAIDYEFRDMTVEVPESTEPDARRAVWKLDGVLRITTSDDKT